jgi:hypothetical protein
MSGAIDPVHKDQLLAAIAGEYDAARERAVALTPAYEAFRRQHGASAAMLFEQLVGAAVHYAGSIAGDDAAKWSLAMRSAAFQLQEATVLISASMKDALREPWTPAGVALVAYDVAEQARGTWPDDRPSTEQLKAQWPAAIAAAAGGVITVDQAAAEQTRAIDEILDEAGLDRAGRIPELFASDELKFANTDGSPAPTYRDLVAERQFWREHQACELDELLRAWDQKRVPKAWLMGRIHNAYLGLKEALAGEFYERCEGCGRQIRPGEIEIPCTDVRVHADCSGLEGGKAGDHIKAPPESIEVEEGQEPRDYVVAFETKHLFTADEIQDRVRRARDVLAQAGRI